MKKIIFTGGSGRFGKVFKKFYLNKKNISYPSSKVFDVTNFNKMEKYIKKIKPKIIIHTAAISRPMVFHEKKIDVSINTNIIGTANIVTLCQKYKIKLIYFSTNYVYPSKKGNYKEYHPLLPINNYAWSKLGGESSVIMYKNSLILRASITEKPFVHKVAFVDFKTNFIFHEDLVPKIMKVLNCKGVLNVGGKSQSVYNFVKKYNKKIKRLSAKNVFGKKAPLNVSMNISKFKKLIK